MTNTVLSDVKDQNQSEKWVEMTMKCVELWDPTEVEYIKSPQKVEQCGLLEDADGEEMRFVSWNNSDPPLLAEGRTYNFEDLFLVYGRNEDGFKLIFRSDTEGHLSDSGIESTSSEGACPHCDAKLDESDYNEGPGAPEVGWEYYTCPDCNAKLRPEVV